MLDRPSQWIGETPLVSAPGSILHAAKLTLEIGGKRLIDNLDLSVPKEGRTMVLGPNGAGKSLLLRLLHGLIRPTDGHIFQHGRALTDATRSTQAMVFQKPVLLRRSAAANIDYVLGRGTEAGRRRTELLEMVNLADKAGQPARSLSGGEQQRLALARALANHPDLLFLDESTASLDPASVALIESILRRIGSAGTKIVMVTHDIGQARRLADDVVFMNRGRVVEHSPAKRFFSDPVSKEAQAFLAGQIVL